MQKDPQNAVRVSSRFTRALVAIAAVFGTSCDLPASDLAADEQADQRVYQVDYLVTPRPDRGGVEVTLTLRQSRNLLRELDMRLDAIDPDSIKADGNVRLENDRLLWNPPADGGEMSWFAPVGHVRSQGSYDAHIQPSWAIFRAEDIIPPARTRVLKGAKSDTRLKFDLEDDWSSVTQYFGPKDDYSINNTSRRFDQPTGWILLGNIGVRYDKISGVRVTVAGPVGHSVRRLDILALLQWTLPELERILGELPARLTIISAASPMWTGGLSAPSSLFVHSQLPLISENATSTLLHEVLHVSLDLQPDNGADWIVEGLAEYYGLELLRRSRSISATRHKNAIAKLRDWGKDISNLCEQQSTGPITARATVIFQTLNKELQNAPTDNVSHNLDELVQLLKTQNNKISVASLQQAAMQLTGTLPPAIQDANLPGCFE